MFGNFKEQKFVLLKDCTNFIDYRGKTPILSENGIRIINAKSVGMVYLNILMNIYLKTPIILG